MADPIPTTVHTTNGLDEKLDSRVFQYDAVSPQLQPLDNLLLFDGRRQDNGTCLEPQLAQLSKGLKPSHLGQREVQHEDLRVKLGNEPYGFFAICSFTDNTQPRFSLQHHPQTLPNHCMIFRNDDVNYRWRLLHSESPVAAVDVFEGTDPEVCSEGWCR